MTIQEAVTEYLKRLKNSKSENTARTYAAGLEEFLTYLGELKRRPIDELTPRHFIDYLDYLLEKFESKRTAINREAAVKSFRDWLTRKDLLTWTPQNQTNYTLSKRDAFSKRSYIPPKVAPKKDVEKIIEFVSNMDTYYPIENYRNVAVVYLLASSGIRVSEAAALKVKDIDLAELTIVVRKGKGDKEDLPSYISTKAAEAIRFYWEARRWAEPNQPAFARHDKQVGDEKVSVNAAIIQRMMRELCRQAGVENITPHKFRHYVVTEVWKKHGPKMAQEWVHHSSYNTTAGYAHILTEDVKEASKTMWD